AIAAWNGSGPFKVTNTYLEAAGENIMFGGADSISSALVPSDIEFQNNYCYKRLSWFVDDPTYAGLRWTIKNLFELKCAQRVLINHNTFDRQSHGDAGQLHAIVFTVRNQDGTAPWSVVQDVTFTGNTITHVGGGWDVLGNDNNFSSQTSSRILVQNNVWDIDGIAWGGRGDFCQLTGGVDIAINHNTVFNSSGTGVINNTPILFTTGSGGLPITATDQCIRLIFTNNICYYNGGFFGDLGAGSDNAAFTAYAPSITFRRNALIAGVATNLPADNFYPVNIAAVGFASQTPFPDARLLASSPFAGAALDSTDVGMLFQLLENEETEAGRRLIGVNAWIP
ncbi:MAG TPA: hypothetical protein VNH41_00450, partial [Steroidobacteraceae bacterium]|nr:hypothetical protein [Steroidobacteraceae bacterium]